ncbi:hypothetical protein CY34DRAFT_25586 [Suillus luteus UH-Slu-Lm8-n1]|uniref:RNase H type-1 domain-containing protein n=1 Tax=Suillus luteus UH-Slu-Lm8-n1 TaxID=930992 RepID=A0A0D0A9X0_9AGAM|nr:hypothetical protein CY34DRAFT_25586 [Suillus luteus UH-Slu-Lm8-n1]
MRKWSMVRRKQPIKQSTKTTRRETNEPDGRTSRCPSSPPIDSKYVINGLTTHLKHWEDIGWIGIDNATFFQAIAYQLRRRPAPTTFQWVKGHAGHLGNERADHLALTGTLRPVPDTIDTYVPRNFDVQGAKLSDITQQLAYKAIMKKTQLNYHRSTLCLLDVTRFAIEPISKTLETDEAIWRGCRNKDITKNIQMFIYKTLNNAYRIGDFWSPIPAYEHRAKCMICRDEIENMEHILVLCNDPARKIIWDLAKGIWPTEHGPWPDPHIGIILGCGLISLPQAQNNENLTMGASRLLRILISESAYLIWVLRCERVIRGTDHSENTIKKRWVNAIDKRLQLDRALASKNRRKPKTTTKVENTWSGIIHDSSLQPPQNNWATNLEVLVGIKLPRPSQTEATR